MRSIRNRRLRVVALSLASGGAVFAADGVACGWRAALGASPRLKRSRG
jgi:hypothetical protein